MNYPISYPTILLNGKQQFTYRWWCPQSWCWHSRTATQPQLYGSTKKIKTKFWYIFFSLESCMCIYGFAINPNSNGGWWFTMPLFRPFIGQKLYLFYFEMKLYIYHGYFFLEQCCNCANTDKFLLNFTSHGYFGLCIISGMRIRHFFPRIRIRPEIEMKKKIYWNIGR